MKLNLRRFPREKIIWLWENRCKCGHRYLEHYNCYRREIKNEELAEKIGFLDIEGSNLNATFGIVYTYCIKELDGKLIARKIGLRDLKQGIYDKRLIEQFIEDALTFDRLITHYGTDRRYDLPMLRSRAVKWGLSFPEHKVICVSDTYPILKNKFKLHSNRLEVACDFFDIPSKKHKLNSDQWLKMITGNPRLMNEAIEYILLHNKEDVYSLEALYKKIHKFVGKQKTSI